jgi:hypothetical protein
VRYYDLAITQPSTGFTYQPTPLGGLALTAYPNASTFSSILPQNFSAANAPIGNPINNRGALLIEFDVPLAPMDQPQGAAIIRITGPGLPILAQSGPNLNGQNFRLKAGMIPGLPLATAAWNAKQAGLILQGRILQAFGNWKGTLQTLDLLVQAGATQITGIDLPFSWPIGSSLENAIATAIITAFPPPNFTFAFNIQQSLQPLTDQVGHYNSIAQLAKAIHDITQPLGQAMMPQGQTYPGVQIFISGSTIIVTDSPSTVEPVQLAFQDLIGQPTWLGPLQISFQTVLRADIGFSRKVIFPKGLIAPYALTSQGAAVPGAPARNGAIFQNSFIVQEIHHYANSRQPNGESWNTTFSAAPVGNLSLATAA